MFDVFKKKKRSTLEREANVQSPEVNYMSAKETLELASKKWTTLPTDKIFKEIESAAKIGIRRVTISEAYISDEQLTLLNELGYKVKVFTSEDCHPFFVVSW